MALTLREVAEILECEVVTGEELIDKISVEQGCAADLMSDVLAFSSPGSLLITGLVNAQAVRTALIAEVEAIVFARGKRPQQEAVELAKENGIPLLCTKLFMYDACGRLYSGKLRGVSEVNVNYGQ
ncbi:MAG TPA: DRTGG domain-containing protein [Acidobacteriota bacterium]|nr:DRTGG domain-containing protein [Acidobacteriota bacterium]